ncbi:MAG: hypothetical protein IKZ62_06230 [Prevotella sp.]|nr:hypothetical protein [Prevotella sp.]
MRKLFFFLMMMPLCCVAQTRYCASWQDFLSDQWQEVKGRVELKPSSKQDRLALEVSASDKKTASLLRKSASVVEYVDSLYLNLRPFNTFGDVYVRAWRLGDKVLFARQDIAPSRFSIANGDSGIPFTKKSFGSLSKLENLVCYLAAWDPQREELRIARVTSEVVAQLLANHSQQLAQYQQLDRKRQEAADVVITTLQQAGIIR